MRSVVAAQLYAINMNKNGQQKRKFFYGISILIAFLWFLFAILGSIDFRISDLFIFILMLATPFIDNHYTKRKIDKLKKTLNVTDDLTLEELEQLRIERDHQEKIAKKFKL